jgi:RNA polymerase sigma factor (sigma-70 family)
MGDRAAGSRLIERNSGLVLQFFRNKVSGPTDDLVQQTFLNCIEHRDDVRVADKFRSYLLTVAHRVLLEHYRIRSRDERHFDPLTTSVWDLEATPSTILVDRQEQQLLIAAMRRIPLCFQIALELYYWQNLTGPELCAVLELPEGTVRSRLRRGRELLRRELEALGAAPAPDDADIDALATGVRARLERE